jgi:hypothetical protein
MLEEVAAGRFGVAGDRSTVWCPVANEDEGSRWLRGQSSARWLAAQLQPMATLGLEDGARPGSCTNGLGAATPAVASALRCAAA